MQKVRVRARRAAFRVSPCLYGNGITPITTPAGSVRDLREQQGVAKGTGGRIMQKVRVRAGRAAVRVSPRLYGNGLTPITTRASSVREPR